MSKIEKHLLVLRGKANTGKTSTFKLIYNQLVADHDTGCLNLNKMKLGKETKAIFYKSNTLIGMSSAGDSVAQIQNGICTFLGLKCPIILCAAHPSIKHNQLLDTFSTEFTTISFFDKVKADYPDTFEKENTRAAADIISKINAILLR